MNRRGAHRHGGAAGAGSERLIYGGENTTTTTSSSAAAENPFPFQFPPQNQNPNFLCASNLQFLQNPHFLPQLLFQSPQILSQFQSPQILSQFQNPQILSQFQNPQILSQFQNPSFQLPQNPSFLLPTAPSSSNRQPPSFSLPNTAPPLPPPAPEKSNNQPKNPSLSLPTAPRPPQPAQQKSYQPSLLERAEAAAKKAREDLAVSGESVTGWKVVQAVLVALKADSWSALGFQLQDVRFLRELFLTEGKVNTFIHCYVAARKITSFCDLEAEICKNEGVEQFEELGLGPFSRHPLVVHYFSVPSDLSEVLKISSEEIIVFLQKFMDKTKKKFTAEEFLDYLAKQKSVPSKEKLGVRIQSLGLHISFLRQARRDEVNVLKDSTKYNVDSSREKDSSQTCSFHLGKRVLDKRFDVISRRIKSFSTELNDFSGKHIRFESTDDEVDADGSSDDGSFINNSNSHNQSSLHNKDIDMWVSSCPYPSTTEEMKRLGLKSEISKKPASGNGKLQETGQKRYVGKKRKFEEENGSSRSLCKVAKKRRKVEVIKKQKMAGLFLSIGKLEKFITTWKDTCREHSVQQVLDSMANYYGETQKQRNRIRKFFSIYPGIGLLNVAVRSMGCGLLDSLYDAIQGFGENKFICPSSTTTTEVIEVVPSSKENAARTSNKNNDELGYRNEGNNELGHSVTIDDVTNKVAEYFESNVATDVQMNGKCIYLKVFHDCERWVTSQFSVEQFSSFGHGTFLGFLEKYAPLFPPKLSSLIRGELPEPSSLEAFILQQQIGVLLCQSESSWLEDGVFAKDDFFMLLKKQFPTIGFHIVENKSGRCLLDHVERVKQSGKTKNILFSVPLLEKRWSGHLSNNNNKIVRVRNDIAEQSSFRAVSSQDAINCLLKAPMLSDLLLWSHWDLLYAPSLGPFLEWWLNRVHIEELSCIVTRDGKFIRIEPSATVDQFLECFIQCSPFQVAVKLLSLLRLYNGSSNAPISLLKCYAQRAVDVIMSNYIDSVKVNTKDYNFVHMEPQSTHNFEWKSCSSSLLGDEENSQVPSAGSVQCESVSKIDDAVSSVAKFILECLGYFPPEFWSFAADILLAGLRPFTKNAYSAILRECSEKPQHCMLHDIGLSLGVAEWVEDYHEFCSVEDIDANKENYSLSYNSDIDVTHRSDASEEPTCDNSKMLCNDDIYLMNDKSESFTDMKGQVGPTLDDGDHMSTDVETVKSTRGLDANKSSIIGETNTDEAALVIETIRREEFGLDPNLSYTESCLLKKQHCRLGRALHCLSQELYSQDSHLLLELVQNADDNIYPENVEPTLVFILQDTGVVVLNNERGFSAENIRALCDIGNSTKKGSSGGYIGHKGIGFKSVFRVTDTPEIHSNGFHVKFDITKGQIGFVLPTVVSPLDVNTFSRMVSVEDNEDSSFWNTCILLPFRSKLREGTGMCSIVSMFSDLHPSLLLFLHRLKCIKFKNVLNETLLVMRRKSLGDGVVKVSHGNETMSWLVVGKKLQSSIVRQDVRATEIAMAFTLQETENGDYQPYLKQQPVFAFLPLRNYGLKFILQGDFVLPSSREEVDGDSAWNQWLLSEFPALFVSAEENFCALPCFQRNPGKAITAFMSFVPLVGEVHGVFSQLPHMIISKLRMTRCLILEGPDVQWVYPCSALRGWDEQARILLSDSLLHKHLGLGYLSKDIIISDTLSRALGVQDYEPKVLTEVMSSMCHIDGCIESLGMEWLCAWFITLHSTLLAASSRNCSMNTTLEGDILCCLRKMPFIPLSDGSFSSVSDGPIWLPCDVSSAGLECKNSVQDFPSLYANLPTLSPFLLSVPSTNKYLTEEMKLNNLVDMLLKIGVKKLSTHEIIKSHILVSLTNCVDANMDKSLMIEYLTFIMLHFQSSCASCSSEKEGIISELNRRPVLLTNHGYKCPADEPIHFGKDYGNSIDVEKLLDKLDVKWIELDGSYLRHPSSHSLPFGLKRWRQFFQELGVTDFVRVILVERTVSHVDTFLSDSLSHDNDLVGLPSVVYDWDSPELVSMLSVISSKKCRRNCMYLLEVLDKLWDDCYSAKTRSLTNSNHTDEKRTIESSFIKSIRKFKWMASSVDEDLHYATDLFCDCENVRSLLGSMAPYAVPQVSSKLLQNDIGFKTQVLHSDALIILNSWRVSKVPFSASVNQMSKFYTFISEGVADSKINMKLDFLSSSFIFSPLLGTRSSELTPGEFLSPKDLYWHDPTGCFEIIECLISIKKNSSFPTKMLAAVYPSLREFFIKICGVPKVPTISEYLEILLQLSNVALPSQVANQVFQVFLRWANDLHAGIAKMEDILYLKESLHKLDKTIVPTLLDKWVSLHPSFGLICWADDEELKNHFKNCSGVDFIQLGKLSSEDYQMHSGKIGTLMQSLGVPAISKVVSREAIFYGTEDNREKASLMDWLLPYMQRYLYKMHPDIYFNFKQYESEKLGKLQAIVVEKLFYKYTLKGRESSSKSRVQCCCLLQGNILYVTRDADPHSVFLELSRLFFNGTAELHFANFLHMVKTMAESGSTKEQIEFFIVNSQGVPVLPEEESVWTLSSLYAQQEGGDAQPIQAQSSCEPNVSKCQRKPGIISSWPPTDWKTAPDFRSSRKNQSFLMQGPTRNDIGSFSESSKSVECGQPKDSLVPIQLEGDWIIEDGLVPASTLVLEGSMTTDDEPQMVLSVDSANGQIDFDLQPGSSSSCQMVGSAPDKRLVNLQEERDRLYARAPDEAQTRKTGRVGEAVAYKYFVEQLGSSNVKWVNEETETGLPYDLVVSDKEGITLFVEVKATVCANKDWFKISMREWQFAAEKGDLFSIAHVVLRGPRKASIIVLKNPYKLCQQNSLHLAIMMSRQHRDSSVTT